MSRLLAFEQVAVVRGGRLLFEDLDLALEPGEALHVAGPNGSGKSSLLRLAAGLLAPERGTVERPVPAALADHLPALDRELALERALAFWGGDSAAAIAALGLGDLARVPVRLLSSGQLKRAALARVIASGVRLWLLDEPLNALDPAATALLDSAIAAHRSSGGAILAASHAPLHGTWSRIELGR